MSAIDTKPPSSSSPVLGGDLGRIENSSGKATPSGPTFGSVLAAARPILKGAESAAAVLPGGPLVAAALKGPTTMANTYGPKGGMTVSPGGVTMVPRPIPSAGAPGAGPIPAAPGVGGPGAPNPSAFVGPGADSASSMDSLLADSQAFNLYYLQLQEEISAENRSYSAMSNVLKARHDTVKNAIGNIR